MALQMSYTSSDGVTHTSSYWKPVQISLDDVGKSGRVLLYGYHDAASFTGGKTNVGSKAYDIGSTDYASLNLLGLTNTTVKAVLVAYILAIKDTPSAPDENGVITYSGFFDGATPVA